MAGGDPGHLGAYPLMLRRFGVPRETLDIVRNAFIGLNATVIALSFSRIRPITLACAPRVNCVDLRTCTTTS